MIPSWARDNERIVSAVHVVPRVRNASAVDVQRAADCVAGDRQCGRALDTELGTACIGSAAAGAAEKEWNLGDSHCLGALDLPTHLASTGSASSPGLDQRHTASHTCTPTYSFRSPGTSG